MFKLKDYLVIPQGFCHDYIVTYLYFITKTSTFVLEYVTLKPLENDSTLTLLYIQAFNQNHELVVKFRLLNLHAVSE